MNLCDLYSNYCVEEGCRANSAVLRYIASRGAMRPLEKLELSNNYLGTRGLRPIIRLVEYSQTLTHLNIDGNGADNETVEMLCDMLENHLSLEYLSLRANPITVTGGKRLLALVEHNPRIVGVDLTGTDVFDALIYRIARATDANRRRAMGEKPQLVMTEVVGARKPHGYICSRAARTSTEKPLITALPPIAHEAATGKEVASRTDGQLLNLPSGAAAVTKTQPWPPIPALASKEHRRLPEVQQRELLRRYREKVLLFRGISSSQASRTADRAREELMLLEKSTKSPVLNKRSGMMTTITATRAATTGELRKKKSPQSNRVFYPDSLDAINQDNTEDDNSELSSRQREDEGEGEDQEVVEEPRSGMDSPDSPGGMTRRGGRNGDPNEVNTENETPGDTDVNVYTSAEDDINVGESLVKKKEGEEEEQEEEKEQEGEIVVGVENVNDNNLSLEMLRESPQWLLLDNAEQFQILFDSGCRAYLRHDFDEAYTAWNEAMCIAVEKKNREWMAVLSSNLKRLSYEMLVREGVEKLEQNRLEEADAVFELAQEVAQEARNAKWEAEMCKARKDVQQAVFQRCHEAALKVFERAQKLRDQKVTEDDYFVVPGTDVMMQHTEAYVNEWSRMLLVKEAVEIWASSRCVVERIGGSDGRALQNVVDEALDAIACFLVKRCFDTEDTQSLSWMRSSLYSYQECIMLITLWMDMSSRDNFAEHHKLFAAVTAAQIGNFYLATNQLSHAQTQFDTLESLAEDLSDPLLRAAGRTFSAILNWQRSRYSAAEAMLRDAVLEWGALRDASLLQRTDENGGNSVSGHNTDNNNSPCSKLLGSLPMDYVSIMESVSFKYLVSSIASTYRYGEALEVLERSLVCKYRDILYNKMKVNFSAHPTLEHIVATSSQVHSPFIYQMVTHRFDWSVEEKRYIVDEKLLIWVVPQRNELRFVEVGVTKDYKVPSINALIETLRRELLLDPITPGTATTGSDVILTLPKRAWVEPLQMLYTIFVDPVVEFLRALDPIFLTKNGVITMIPTEQLWLVPFNALIARNGNFLVEDFAVQMAFCATQCAFSMLNATRVLERDLQRDVVLVQRETDTPALHLLSHVAFPFDSLRSQKEGDLIMRTLAEHNRGSRQSIHTTDSVSMTTSSEILVEDLNTFREYLPKSRTVFITASTTSATRNDDNSAGAICMAVSCDEIDLLRASEIARMRLFAELVVMSNTNMSIARVVGIHDDVQGLIRGFFSSGVPCIIAGQWCTPDMVPSELFSKFFQLLSDANKKSHRNFTSHEGLPTLTRMRTTDTVATTTTVTPTTKRPTEINAVIGAGEGVDEVGGHEAANVYCHKALILAWAIRALLEDNFFRFSPRVWAGYCCIGHGSHQ